MTIYFMGTRGARNSLENSIKLVVLYMEFRKVGNLGYLPYSHFRNLIKYCLSISDKVIIRRIFDSLVARHVFSIHTREKKHSKQYLFNPHNRPHRMRLNFLVDYLD
tara:strand:+ start:305 stop:622 length:318 start_codon:yes stop_codon:yes gene_type:complete